MAEFRVVIEGLELDDELTKTINESIQRVVLDQLVNVDLTTGRKPRGVVAYRPRPDWYGLVAQIISQKDLGRLPEVGELRERFR